MRTIKPTELRDRQKEYLDMAASGELVFVHRPKKRNVYVVSEQNFDTLSEQARAYRNAQYLAKLDKARKDYKDGKYVTFESVEALEEYAEARIKEMEGGEG